MPPPPATTGSRPRARAMAADERRAALVEAARPLLLEHGRATTTRQVADAAGVAEGTLFRVFPTKDDLVDAVVARELEPGPVLSAIAAIDPHLPLEERLVAATTALQRRLVRLFTLMTALAMARPPQTDAGRRDREQVDAALVAVVEPDAALLRVPPAELVRLLRLLTFSGSHPHLSLQRPLTPAQVVDVVLHGTLGGVAGRSGRSGRSGKGEQR